MKQVLAGLILIFAAASCGGGGAKSADAGVGDDASTAAACPAGQELCGAVCADTNSDRQHCGTCDTACDPGEVCNGAGSCELSCQAGLLDCGGTCVDPDTDEGFCGATGNCMAANAGMACATGEVCNGSGVCEVTCQAGLIECGGTCVDPNTDEGFCGATTDCLAANAGIACASGELCDGAGACALSCQDGLLDCAGTCTDPNSDESFCGATTDCLAANVGVACASGELCDGSGVCATTCQTGLLDCSGTCIDPDSNPTFCGATTDCQAANVGTTCAAGEACVSGACKRLAGASCAQIVSDVPVWGAPARGLDLRSFTGGTLDWMGCTGINGGASSCSLATFYCIDSVAGELSFGTPDTGSDSAMRAVLDPGNANGDVLPATFGSCCSAGTPSDVCNSLTADSNGSGVDSITALCQALGYTSGTIVREENNNSCPEVNALAADGSDWGSDFVNANGWGAEFRCNL